jgi:uncharacterized protein YciI
MFILEVTYTAPMERVEAALPDHLAWLEKQYAAGYLLASGRKVPRDGGIMLAVAPDRATIEAVAASDPFVTAEVCEYRITEFIPTQTAPLLAQYREQPPA